MLIRLRHIFLTEIRRVSKNSWQPILGFVDNSYIPKWSRTERKYLFTRRVRHILIAWQSRWLKQPAVCEAIVPGVRSVALTTQNEETTLTRVTVDAVRNPRPLANEKRSHIYMNASRDLVVHLI